jgi:hypothetical protein
VIRRSSRSSCRSLSSACLRSSMSVLVPYHLTMWPDSSRTAIFWCNIHRYSPSARRTRASNPSGSPLARHARHLATSAATSSRCTADVHCQPSSSSNRSPTNSSQRWLKKSRYPSGRPIWISAGRESMSARKLATSGPWSATFHGGPPLGTSCRSTRSILRDLAISTVRIDSGHPREWATVYPHPSA